MGIFYKACLLPIKKNIFSASLLVSVFLLTSLSAIAAPPRAHHLYISGTTAGANPATSTGMKAFLSLKVWYTFADPDGNPESGTTYQWYTYTSELGTGKTPIAGATNQTYFLTATEVGKFISVEVRPRDNTNTFGSIVEFRAFNSTTLNSVLSNGFGCSKAGGGTVSKANAIDNTTGLCSPRSTTWDISYTGIDYNNAFQPRIFINWGDGGGNIAFVPALDNPLATLADTLNLTFMANQKWKTSQSHIYSYPTTGGTSVASTVANQVCTYTLSTVWGVGGTPCPVSNAQTQPFTVWDRENNTSLGTFDINHDPASAGVETGEITDICAKDQSAIRVLDASDFNCTNFGGIKEGTKENDEGRWIQWVYGTAGSNVTTGAGATEKIIINGVPYDFSQLPVYGRVTYQPGVTDRPLPSVTDDIRMPTSGIAGEVLMVTMRSWNTCNKLDRTVADGGFNPIQSAPFNVFDITNTTAGSGSTQPGLYTQFSIASGIIYANNAPVTRNYTLRIITKPPIPVANNKDFCAATVLDPPAAACGSITTANQALSFELTAAGVTGSTVINWYFGNPLSGGVALNGNTGVYSGGTNCRFFRPRGLLGSGAQGAMRTALTNGTTGVYSLWATYSTANGCTSEPVEVKMTIRPALTVPASPTGPIEVCNGASGVTFSQGSAAGNTTIVANNISNALAVNFGTEYLWSTSNTDVTLSATNTTTTDATFSIATQPNPTATRTITTALRYSTPTTSGAQCNVGTNSISVTVYGTTVGGTVAGGTTICDGAATGTLTLSGHRGSILRWEKDFNGSNVFVPIGATAGLTTYSETPSSGPGTYRYRAVIRNGPTGQTYNCSDVNSASVSVVVNAVPPQPTIGASGPTTFCFGGSVTLTSSNIGSLAAATSGYQWYKDGVAVTGQTNSSITLTTVAQSGSYTVKVIGVTPSNCESPISLPTVVTINPLPSATVTGGGSACSGVAASDIVWTLTGTQPFNFTITSTPAQAGFPIIITGYTSGTYTIVAPNPAAATNYEMTVLTDANTCPSSSLGGPISVTPQLVPPPSVDAFTGQAAVCDDGASTNPPDAILDLNPNSVQDYAVSYRLRRISTGLFLAGTISFTQTSTAAGIITITPTYAQFGSVPNDPLGYQVVITAIQNVNTGCAGAVPINGPTLIINPRPATPTGAVSGIACSTAGTGASISVAIPTVGYTIAWSTTAAPTFTAAAGVTGGTRGNTFTPGSNATATYHAFTRDDITPTNCLSSASLPVQHIQDVTPTTSIAGTNNANCTGTFTLGGNTPNTGIGEIGTWTVPGILYQQNFSGYTNQATSAAANGWSRNVSAANVFTGGQGYFQVNGGQFELNNADGNTVGNPGAEVVWLSPVMTGTVTNLSISVDLSSSATHEAGDYLKVFYKLNGGAEVALTNGNQLGNIAGTVNATATGLNGTSIQFVVRANNNATDEFYRFDNILMSNAGAPTISNPNDRLATVTNLPVGANVLTWTISSLYGVCPVSLTTVTLTRHPLPTVNTVTPSLCEDLPGGGSTGGVLLSNYDILVADEAGAPVALPLNTTVEYYSAATRLPGNQITAPTTIINGQTVFTRVRNSSTTCTSDGTMTFTVRALPAVTNHSVQICEDTPPGSLQATGINLTLYEATITGGVANRDVEWYNDPSLAAGNLIPAGNASGAEQNYSISADVTLYAKVIDTSSPTIPPCFRTATMLLDYQGRPNNNIIKDASNTPVGATYTICASGSLILLQIDPTINPGATYTWNVPTPVPSTQFELLTGTTGYFIILKFPNAIPSPGIPISVIEKLGTAACAGNTLTTSVIVEGAPPKPVITGPSTVCSEANGIVFSVPFVGGSTYSWTLPPGATITSLPVTSNSITVQMSTFSGIVTVVQSSGNGCTSPAADPFPVAVVNRPSITSANSNVLCSGENVQVVHTLTSNIAGTTYNWKVVGITGFVTGSILNDSDNGVTSINQTLTNTSGVTASVTYQITPIGPTSGASPSVNCPGTPQNLTITVNPEPVLNLNSKVICSNEAAGYEIKLSPNNLPSGTTFSWGPPVMSSGPAQGTAGSSVAMGAPGTIHINDIFTNTTTSSITATYLITAQSGLGCASNQPATSREVVITINPRPVGANDTQLICSNAAVNYDLQNNIATLGNNLVTGTTYSWLAASNVNVSGESQTSQLGATISDVLRNVTASNQVVLYTVTPVSAGLCTGPTFTISVTVQPEPRGYNDATPVSCSDVALSYSLSSNIANTGLGGNNLTTGTTYSWTAAANPNVTGESVSPQSTVTINDIITNVTSSNQTVVYTVIPTSSLGCTGNAFTVSFTIRPEPKGFDDATPIICSDTNVNYNLEGNILNVGLGGNGLITGTTYSWIAMANPSVTGESITSQPGKTITDVLNNVTNADQQVIYTVTPVSANGCSGDNFIITITVRPEPKGFNDTTPVICSDDPVNYSLTANIANTVSGGNNLTTGTTFSWIAASNANVGGESTTSQLGNTITDILNNVTNTDRVVIYTVTPSSANGCPGDPFTVSVIVRPEPRGYNDNTPFVCSDGAVNYNLIANVANTGLGGNNLTTGTTFSWIAASNVNVGGESTSAQLSSSINDNLTNITNTNQFVVYTVTPSSALGCAGNSFVITITVRPEPRGFDDPSPLVCSNDPINYNLAANVANTGAGGNNVTVGTTFSWVAADNANTIGESTTPQSGSVINNVIRNATNTNQVVIYTITPTSADGCDGDPFIVSITVKPEPKGYNDTTPFTCSDVAFNYDLSLNVANVGLGGNNLVVGTTYSWIAASNGNVSGESLSAQAGSIITDVLNNVTASNQVVVYTVTPTSATGCVGASFTVSVEVRPEPKGFNDNAPFICSDATVNYDLVANVSNTGLGGNNLVTGTTFSWIAASNSNVTGESTTIQGGSTITDALNNVTNSIQVVVYTITPTSSLGCIGNPFTISINVRPEPQGFDDTTPVICSDAAVNYNLVTNISNIGNGGNNLVTGTTFSWIAAANPNVSGESNVTSGTASSITDILNNITSGNEVVVYTVTPRSSDGCFGNPFTVSVTVQPEPKGFNDTTPVACSDIALNYDLTANIANTVAGGNNLVTGTTYTWVATPNANVGGESSGVTDHITDVLNNVTNINQIVVYTVTPVSADGCTGNSFTVSVTVRPEPRGFADNTPLICSDDNVNYDLAANIGNTVSGGNNLVTGNTYSWIAVNNPNVTGESFATPGTGSVINDVLNNVTNTNQVVTYTVIPTSSLGCVGNSFTVTVTVRPEPRGFDDSTPVICSDAAVNYDLALNIANLGSGGNNLVTGTTYSWIAASNPNVTGETTGTPGTSQVINDVLNNVTNANQFVIYTVTPTSTNGCPGNPFTVNVTVQPEPKGFIDNTPVICSDDQVNYSLSGNIANTVAGGNNLVIGTTYTWIAAANANVTGESLTPQSGVTITDFLNNITNANQVVVYTVTPRSSNNCFGDPFTVSITVRPEPKGFNDNTPLICSDDPVNYDLVNNILNTTAGGNALTTGTTYSWIAADNPSVTGESLTPVATSSITDVLVNASGSNQVVVYTVTPTSGNLCTGNTFQISVTVRSKPVGADDNSPTVCSDEAISYNIQTRNINTLGNLVASTFTYTVVSSDPANVSAAGKNRTIASNAAITDTYTNLTSSDVLVTYTVTPFSNPGNCVGTSFDITFTIHPEPKGPNTAIQLCSDAPINYNLQTVINTAVTGNSVPSKFKYSVTSSNPLAVPAGPNRNTPSAALINDVYTNLSSADVDIIYTVTPYSLSDDCEGTPFTLTVTVHPEPVGQSIVDPVCSTLLNHDIQSSHITNGINSVFTYTVASSDPIGVPPAANRTVASNSLITDSYANTTGIDVTVTYTITPFSVTDNCEGTPFTYTVTISSKPVGAASIKTPVCSDVPFSFNPQNDITNGVVSTFTWTAVYNGLTVNGAAPPAAGTGLIAMALTNLGNTTLNAEFTVLPKSGNCDGLPYVITVPILPEPVVATNLNETKCSGDAYGKLLNTNGTSVGAATYDVTVVSKDSGLTGGRSVGLIGTGNSLDNILLTDAYVNTTATPLKVVYSVVPHGTNGCTGDMKLIEFTINPEPVLLVPAPPAICSRDITNIVLGTNGTSINAQTYRLTQIEYSSNAGPFTTTAPADFTFPATNKLVASSGGIDHVKSDVFTNKSAFQVVVRYTIVPVSPGTPFTPLGCDGDPATVDIAVNPEPILDPAISPPASRVAICSGDKIDPIGTGFELRSQAGSVASAKFIIRSISFPGLTSAGTNAPVNVQILKDDLDNDTYVNVNNIALNVTYTIAPISALGCIGEDSQLIIVVNPAPSVKVGLDRVVCSNAISGIVLEDNAPTSIAASSYEIVSITSTGLTADAANATTGITTDVNRIRNDKFINLTNDRVIVTYQVVPISITNCRGPQTAITLTVEPVIVSTSINNSPNICSATPVNIVFNSPTYDPLVATNPLVTFSYKLVTPIPSGISGYTSGNNLNEGEAITDILVNSTNNAITVQYQITPRAATAANGTGCPGTPEIIDVLVQPRPKISAVPNKTVCEGDPINLNLTSLTVPSIGVIKFRVTAVAENASVTGFTSGTLLANATVLADVLSNTDIEQRYVDYTFEPINVDASDATICANGIPVTVRVTVNPRPEVTPSATVLEICSSESIEVQLPTDTDQSATIVKWTASASSIDVVGESSGAGDVLFQTLLNKGNAVQTVDYTITPSFNGCDGPSKHLFVTVNPIPTVTLPNKITVCGGTTFNLNLSPLANTAAGQTTFKWEVTDISGIGTPGQFDGTGTLISQTFVNNTDASATLLYQITPIFNGSGTVQCEGIPRIINVSVAPTITAAFVSTDEGVCEGTPVFLTFELHGQSPFEFVYSATDANGTVNMAVPKSGNVKVDKVTPTLTTVYRIVSAKDALGCEVLFSPQPQVTITVYQKITAAWTANIPPFVGGSSVVNFTNTSTPVNGTVFNYDWSFGTDGYVNPLTSTQVNPAPVTYTRPGDHYVSLTASNKLAPVDLGCESTFAAKITIPVLPLFADFRFDPKAACFPQTIKITENTATGAVMDWEVKDINGGIAATSNASLPEFLITNPGKYTITLRTFDPFTHQEAFAPTTGKDFVIYDNPVASFDVRPTLVYVPDTELTTFNFSTGAPEYLWDFGDGGTSTEPEPKYTYKIEGIYDITLIAMNDHGDGAVCADTLSRKITAKQGGITKVPNAFTPNPNGPSGGIAGNNTFNDVFLPLIKGAEEFNMQIFDRWGNLIFESNNSNIGWDGYDKNSRLMPAGVYVYKLTVRLSDGQRSTQIGDITMIR